MGTPSGTVGTASALADRIQPHTHTHTRLHDTYRHAQEEILCFMQKALAGRTSVLFRVSVTVLATFHTHSCIPILIISLTYKH